jgi:hypothetical protein
MILADRDLVRFPGEMPLTCMLVFYCCRSLIDR